MQKSQRNLGLVEHLFAVCNELSGMVDVNVIQLRGALRVECLNQAWRALQHQYEVLQLTLCTIDGVRALQWTPDFEVTPQLLEAAAGVDEWTVAEAELAQRIETGAAPLLRIVLLRKNATSHSLILSFHHTIIDGLSALHLTRSLLQHYAAIVTHGHAYEGAPQPLLPALDDFLRHHAAPGAPALRPHPAERIERTFLPYAVDAALDQRRTRLWHATLLRSQFMPLLARCRQENTTVHGALSAAMLLASLDGRPKLGEGKMAVCGSNINLRPYCQPALAAEAIGCFVGSLATEHLISGDSDFWVLARACRASLADIIDSGRPQFEAGQSGLIPYIGPDMFLDLAQLASGRENSVHVSNLQSFAFGPDYAGVSVDGFHFATGQHLIGTCFWLGVVTLSERMCLSFAAVEPLIPLEVAKRMSQRAIRLLLDNAAPTETSEQTQSAASCF